MQFETLNIIIMWTFPWNWSVVNEQNIQLEEGSGLDEGNGGDSTVLAWNALLSSTPHQLYVCWRLEEWTWLASAVLHNIVSRHTEHCLLLNWSIFFSDHLKLATAPLSPAFLFDANLELITSQALSMSYGIGLRSIVLLPPSPCGTASFFPKCPNVTPSCFLSQSKLYDSIYYCIIVFGRGKVW